MSKILTREQLVAICRDLKRQGKRVGFTSGVFDILHSGHCDYLAAARGQCDVLIVAVNSDASVRAAKGPLRPIRPAAERLAVLSALTVVDFVFSFDEQNNNENVKLLTPSIYFKAGDYAADQLSSKPLVEAAGGKVVIVPFSEGHSSSSVIEDVLAAYGPKLTSEIPAKLKRSGKIAFLDRDGTINKEVHYLHEPEKFEFLPGSLEAMKLLNQADYSIVVVTNQPGINLGYYTRQDFFKVNSRLLRKAGEEGVVIIRIFFCPHTEGEDCECRKPKPGMLERGLAELSGDTKQCLMIGDRDVDVLAGKALGIKTGLIESHLPYSGPEPDHRAANLLEVIRKLI